jgi:hypothetical protein
VLHLNLNGGSRDLLVKLDPISSAHFGFKNSINLGTHEMRNLHTSIDHNSPYYYKYFLDAFVPSLFTAFLTPKHSQETVGHVRNLLTFNPKSREEGDAKESHIFRP